MIQGLQGWSALVQVRVREALFDKGRGESAVCQGCEEGRETPELSALLDFLESPDHLLSSISQIGYQRLENLDRHLVPAEAKNLKGKETGQPKLKYCLLM